MKKTTAMQAADPTPISKIPELSIGEAIGTAIRQLRESRNMRLIDLSSRSGVTVSMISMIETGKRNTSQVSLEKLAKALDTSVAALLMKAISSVATPPSAEHEAVKKSYELLTGLALSRRLRRSSRGASHAAKDEARVDDGRTVREVIETEALYLNAHYTEYFSKPSVREHFYKTLRSAALSAEVVPLREVYFEAGRFCYDIRCLDGAMRYFAMAEPQKGGHEERAKICMYYGLIHAERNQYREAVSFINKSTIALRDVSEMDFCRAEIEMIKLFLLQSNYSTALANMRGILNGRRAQMSLPLSLYVRAQIVRLQIMAEDFDGARAELCHVDSLLARVRRHEDTYYIGLARAYGPYYRVLALCRESGGLLHVDRAAIKKALQGSFDVFETYGFHRGQVSVCRLLGEVHREWGDFEAARDFTVRALQLAEMWRVRPVVLDAVVDLARWHHAVSLRERGENRLSEVHKAIDAVGRAIFELRSGGVAHREADCTELLGQILLAHTQDGHCSLASTLFRSAAGQFKRLGFEKKSQRCAALSDKVSGPCHQEDECHGRVDWWFAGGTMTSRELRAMSEVHVSKLSSPSPRARNRSGSAPPRR